MCMVPFYFRLPCSLTSYDKVHYYCMCVLVHLFFVQPIIIHYNQHSVVNNYHLTGRLFYVKYTNIWNT